MKKLICILAIGLLFSCKEEASTEALYPKEEITQTPEALGKEIFEGKGICYTCHKEEVKTVGPSLKEIAKIYGQKGASISEFLNEKSNPIVDPSQFATMKANFAVTKNLSDEERKALEAYILSFSK